MTHPSGPAGSGPAGGAGTGPRRPKPSQRPRRAIPALFAAIWRPMLRAAGLDPYGRRRLSELT